VSTVTKGLLCCRDIFYSIRDLCSSTLLLA
jgi:hypothetical protein